MLVYGVPLLAVGAQALVFVPFAGYCLLALSEALSQGVSIIERGVIGAGVAVIVNHEDKGAKFDGGAARRY